jgi:peptide/nickel transport system substrate-binding protein
MGSETPFSYWYYPFNKGYSTERKIPPYDPAAAKRLLAEAGHAGFEVRVNPMVLNYALDGPDMMEAVALDWEKIGIKVRRVPEAFSNFLPKIRARKTGKTHWVYGSPPYDEPSLAWQRTVWSKGAFNLLAERPYDADIDSLLKELDAEKRVRMTRDMGQKLYDQYLGVMLGMKTITWAVSNKVRSWQTLVYVPLENNYETIA